MLESGFLGDVKQILRPLPPKASGWQGMCFSATIPPKVKDVISVHCSQAIRVSLPLTRMHPLLLLEYPSSMSSSLQPKTQHPRISSTARIEIRLQDHCLRRNPNMVSLYAKLFSEGLTMLKVYKLHSRLSQNVRTRTTDEFKAADSGIMFASDVIGRGMDFPNVDLVVQVGLPSNGDQYVHRVGRTARAGNDGLAIIILTQGESFFLNRNPQLPIQPHA